MSKDEPCCDHCAVGDTSNCDINPLYHQTRAYREHQHDDAVDAMAYAMQFWNPKPRWRTGVLFRWGSAWIGAHWSANHKRLCLNLVPFVTIWITAPGGDVP